MIFVVGGGELQTQRIQPITTELRADIPFRFSEQRRVSNAAVRGCDIPAVAWVRVQPCHIVGHLIQIVVHVHQEAVCNGLGPAAAVIGGSTLDHVGIIAGSDHQRKLLRDAEHGNGPQSQLHAGSGLHLLEIGKVLLADIVVAHHKGLHHKPVGKMCIVIG